MKLSATTRADAAVDRVPSQRVREAVAPRSAFLHQPGRVRVVERVEQLAAPVQPLEDSQVERLAQHRRPGQRVAASGREPGDTGEDDVADALGHVVRRVAPLGEVACELVDEERIAVRSIVDSPRVLGAVEQRCDLVHRETLDGQPHDVAVSAEVGDRREERRPDRVCVAVRAEHQQPLAGRAPRDPRQQRERVAVGEVEVVEHEHERTGVRGCGQARLDLLPRRRLAADGLREGRVRDERLLLARAVEDGRPCGAGLGGKARRQPGLADPGFAGQQDDLGRPAAGSHAAPGRRRSVPALRSVRRTPLGRRGAAAPERPSARPRRLRATRRRGPRSPATGRCGGA